VELVHDDLTDVGVLPLAQREVGQDLGGAADDRRVGVDARVAGEHADVGGAELLAQREELLRHEGLDRRGVEADLVAGQRREVRAGGHQALAGAGGGTEDDVRAREDLDERFLLVRVQRETAPFRPFGESVEEGIGFGIIY